MPGVYVGCPAHLIWLPALLALAVLGVAIWPRALHTPAIDLAGLPFLLLLLVALFSTALDDGRRTVVLWLAVPFLGYNFGVALPLTHIYTVVPAWTLLAGLVVAAVVQRVAIRRSLTWLAAVGALIGVVLCAGYLGLAYLRQHVEFRQDWPGSQSSAVLDALRRPTAYRVLRLPASHRLESSRGAVFRGSVGGRLRQQRGTGHHGVVHTWCCARVRPSAGLLLHRRRPG